MAKTSCTLIVGLFLVLSAAARGAAPSEAALDAYRAAHVRGYLEAKPDGLLGYLAEDVRLMPAYQKTVLGKTDAATYYRAFLKRFTVTAYDRKPLEITDLGGRVMEIGTFTISLQIKGQAETHALAGKYMDLWRKSSDGKLILETMGWNHDQMPEIADQLRFADVPSIHMALQPRVAVTGGISFAIAALIKLEESVISQHDGKTWGLFFADDAILLANQGQVVAGRRAIDEYTVSHAKALPVFEKLDLRTDRIDDLGRYVIEYGTGVVNWRMNEYSGVNLGKNIRVWRRADDGALQIWRAISMYD